MDLTLSILRTLPEKAPHGAKIKLTDSYYSTHLLFHLMGQSFPRTSFVKIYKLKSGQVEFSLKKTYPFCI